MQALGTNFEGIPLLPRRISLANFAVQDFGLNSQTLYRKIRQGRKEHHVPRSVPIKLAKPAKFCKNNSLSQPA
jgi:hypothetical protein